ncbi:hypothetical protein LCGC14_1279070 [marine sediment metagenome]|uniref:Uncharacterized protein n=1 Tax=marine sediment metagenome TaxID=412755 RepID=A0A0F9KXI8_9ZZZZ
MSIGKRNQQRGAELQREAVNMARKYGLEAHNRDFSRGHHEKGDVEVEGIFFGCKRKKTGPTYLLPEKQESGVIHRADGQQPQITIPLEDWCSMKQAIKAWDSHDCIGNPPF